jgi:hypothetical protein
MSRPVRGSISALAALALAWLALAGSAGAPPAGAVPAAVDSSPPNTAVAGGYATISVGRITVKRRSAHLPLSCSGKRHSVCFVLVLMRAIEKHRRPIVGGTTVSLAVGRSATIRLPLYPNGKRLLGARHHLRVRLTVETSKFKRIAAATITFGK